MRIHLTLVIVVMMLVASCAPPAVDMGKLRQTIDAYNVASREMWLSGTLNDSVMAYFADDVVEMPEYMPAAKGKDKAREMFMAMMSSGLKYTSFELEVVDVQASGNVAYEIGTYHITGGMADGSSPFEVTGKFITLWKQQSDGSWKVAAELGNNDPPMGQ
jgi:ketosteroid isomerase-like protein